MSMIPPHENCLATRIFSSANLSPEDWARTNETRVKRLKVPKGETLYHAGQAFKHISVINSGYLRSSNTDQSGNAVIFGFHMPGELLGADRLFGGPQDADLVALVDSEVCVIAAEEMEHLLADVPPINRFFNQLSAQNAHRMHNFLSVLSVRTAEQRLAAFLINFGKRLHRRGYSPLEFQVPMGRTDIATYLLLQPETVSRALKALAGRGLIEVNHRRVKILQLDALREFRG